MRRYFTLMEMLVVMLIVVLLSSMLLPALAAGRLKAMQTSCLGNLRQLGMSFLNYSDDWRGRLPPYVTGAKTTDHPGLTWPHWSFPYYGNTMLLGCPISPCDIPQPGKENLRSYDGHYGWNYDGTQGNRGPLARAVKTPSAAYLLFDSGDPCVIYGANNWLNLLEELDLDWDSRLEGANRHEEAVNICFVDGHAGTRFLNAFLSAPCDSYEAPWYIPWDDGRLPKGTIPFPCR